MSLGRGLAPRLADGLKDAALGDTAEIVIDRRAPASLDHVEIDRTGEASSLIEAALQPMDGNTGPAMAIDLLEQGVYAKRNAVGEQSEPAGVVKHDQPIPQCSLVGRHVSLPGVVPSGDRLG